MPPQPKEVVERTRLIKMAYSDIEKQNIRGALLSKVAEDLTQAELTDDYSEIFRNYPIDEYQIDTSSSSKKNMILIVGRYIGKKEIYQKAAEEIGIKKDQLEFIDYDEIKNNNLGKKLKDSKQYSDVIFGPIPHSVRGKKDATSLIEIVENPHYQGEYPNCIRATSNTLGSILKLSKGSFIKSLKKTKYFTKFCANYR